MISPERSPPRSSPAWTCTAHRSGHTRWRFPRKSGRYNSPNSNPKVSYRAPCWPRRSRRIDAPQAALDDRTCRSIQSRVSNSNPRRHRLHPRPSTWALQIATERNAPRGHRASDRNSPDRPRRFRRTGGSLRPPRNGRASPEGPPDIVRCNSRAANHRAHPQSDNHRARCKGSGCSRQASDIARSSSCLGHRVYPRSGSYLQGRDWHDKLPPHNALSSTALPNDRLARRRDNCRLPRRCLRPTASRRCPCRPAAQFLPKRLHQRAQPVRTAAGYPRRSPARAETAQCAAQCAGRAAGSQRHPCAQKRHPEKWRARS